VEPELSNIRGQNEKCGDGICDSFELKNKTCPVDCQNEDVQESVDDTDTQAVLYFSLMVHLEGWFDEIDNEEVFQKHMTATRELAEIFEKHNAKVTFEASPETIEACGKWENVLLELQENGHGIGVHADRGYSRNPNYSLGVFTAEIKNMKDEAESLGLLIQHVSGTCSGLDWAKASIDAGYEFTTGGVGFCAMSMPEEIRPEEYKNCLNPAECHGNMPLEMSGRIHPWRINTAERDWTEHDPNGELVILASDGGIKNLYEASLDPDASHGDMAYTDEDIQILIDKVDEALSLAKPDQVNQIYFSLSIGAADVDELFYTKMFEALKPYVEAGRLEYASLNEVYLAYLSSE
jgi:hypothetical protein